MEPKSHWKLFNRERRADVRRLTLFISIAFLLAFVLGFVADDEKEISLADLRDKIEGGWAGQIIGVSFGAPTEFKSNAKILEGELPAWTPERLSNAIHQDDLYVDMTFAKVLDDRGLDASVADFGEMFRDSKYNLWHANLAARRALKRGIAAGDSGTPRYNVHANDIDFQIEADFIGLMAPGLPQAAVTIADRAGRVMNYGDGLYGGMFVSGMYSAGFFENDVRKVVEAGLACIPAKSPYAELITDLLAWHSQNPEDWKRAWQLIEDKWDKRDPCPAGAFSPFNIDAKLNGAYIALGLLYGNRDFGRTMEISTRAGQDSDCNPSSAAGVLGVMVGYRAIPDVWKAGMSTIADQKFDFTDYTFADIVKSTEKRAIDLVQRNGGRVEGERLIVKTQKPKAPRLDLWDDYGSPAEKIGIEDPRWVWKGNWRLPADGQRSKVRTASEFAAEAEISFEGTGAIVVGPYLPDGGKLEAYIDGKMDRVLDVYSDDEKQSRGGESVWHGFGLKPGKHTVVIKALGEPYGESSGTKVAIESLIVFR
ncbi:MAG: ADP-ribosylglycohydrolase family protein [Acidobacteria bacterium]|nr:MAG: ADP-ribosylglycohydrolase family protein [Acidobacteriota bacterium]